MAFIGEVIKKVIEFSDLVTSDVHPEEAQKKVLKSLLTKAASTAFGTHYSFGDILDQPDIRTAFAERIPCHSYDRIHEEWWHRALKGESDVTWPGKVRYFAVSSGTTSAKKHIPVTEDMMEAIRKAGFQQVKGMADFDLPGDFYEKEILLFGSTTDLNEVDGHLEGEISGISTSRIPFLLESICRPGPDITDIKDWDERVATIAKEAPNWDIGAISGIPSWIEIMMKKVIEYNGVENIHDIWPNFLVFTSGGVAYEPYRKSFEKICGKPIIVIDTYLASEGYLATQVRQNTDAMALLLDNGIYFEFIPFVPENMEEDGSVKDYPKVVCIEDVEEDVDYVVIISTVSGAWRYMIGDTIVFTDKKRKEIKITGRTKHFLNVVGSHLSVNQMNEAMIELEKRFDCDIKEFAVSAVLVDGAYIHRWYIGLDNLQCLDESTFSNALDEVLKEANKNYGVARTKALKHIESVFVKATLFTEWIEETKQKGGQVKFPRVLDDDNRKSWEEFIEKYKVQKV